MTNDIELLAIDQGWKDFTRKWALHHRRLITKRLDSFVGRTIECQIDDGDPAFLTIGLPEVTLTTQRPPYPAHAEIRMSARDWTEVLSGRWHVMAIILAGRCDFPKDQRRILMQFSMLLQSTLLSKG